MTVRVHEENLVCQGRVFKIFQSTVALPNGVTTTLELLRHPGAAAIVPLTADHQIVLLRQYRHAVGKTIWEIPAGTFEAGESPLACARRELTEETGMTAENWHLLGELIPVPGYADENIRLYLAQNLSAARQHLDADEIVEVRPVAVATVLEWIFSSRIVDAKTIAGVLRAARHLGWLDISIDTC